MHSCCTAHRSLYTKNFADLIKKHTHIQQNCVSRWNTQHLVAKVNRFVLGSCPWAKNKIGSSVTVDLARKVWTDTRYRTTSNFFRVIRNSLAFGFFCRYRFIIYKSASNRNVKRGKIYDCALCSLIKLRPHW